VESGYGLIGNTTGIPAAPELPGQGESGLLILPHRENISRSMQQDQSKTVPPSVVDTGGYTSAGSNSMLLLRSSV